MYGSFLHSMENGNTDVAIVSRKMVLFKNNRGVNKGFLLLYPMPVKAITKVDSVVGFRIQPWKQHGCETKFFKIPDPHRI